MFPDDLFQQSECCRELLKQDSFISENSCSSSYQFLKASKHYGFSNDKMEMILTFMSSIL